MYIYRFLLSPGDFSHHSVTDKRTERNLPKNPPGLGNGICGKNLGHGCFDAIMPSLSVAMHSKESS